ncbi:hypothetical protein GDO78_016767 [Eleutherodactylus coqui]|uniref:Uncharacterized protein n=1 Tax=Eleutherodactylus coqui TaxID=57060 RepID=A0A8J6ENY6_ELECQ|nr:hypothetical protein GDO78_016767 [Eleutherodactylus coqui]
MQNSDSKSAKYVRKKKIIASGFSSDYDLKGYVKHPFHFSTKWRQKGQSLKWLHRGRGHEKSNRHSHGYVRVGALVPGDVI